LSIARHGPLANPGLGQRNQAGSRERFLERSWKAAVATGGDLLLLAKGAAPLPFITSVSGGDR
jgi:hypothetical protein